MNITRRLCICIVVCLSSGIIHAQQNYGLFIAEYFNMHSADFRAFPGVPSCCPKYDNGSGAAPAFGISAGFGLAQNLSLSTRLGYYSESGTLRHSEAIVLANNINGVFEHSVEAKLASVDIDLLLSYALTSDLNINLGPRLGLSIQHTFSQKELITDPSTGVFETGLRSRNVVDNQAIPSANSVHMGLYGSLSYNLKLNSKGSLALRPEAGYMLPLSGVVSGMDWKVSQFGISAHLIWTPQHITRTIREQMRERIDTLRKDTSIFVQNVRIGRERRESGEEQTDTEIIKTTTIVRTDTLFVYNQTVSPVPNLSLTVRKVYDRDTSFEKEGLVVEEFSSLPLTPLLSYVFFEENSSDIPARYVSLSSSTTKEFSEAGLHINDRLECYYQVLNIIASRMTARPNSTLTLTGCNADVGVEKANQALSKRRAQSVRDYLHNVWNISESRIKIEARNLPQHAANSQTTDGAQENRRVELSFSDPSIGAPLNAVDTIRRVHPPLLRVFPKTSGAAVDNWSFKLEHAGVTLQSLRGRGQVPDSVEVQLNLFSSKLRSGQNLDLSFAIADSLGREDNMKFLIAVRVLTVQQKRAEHRADKEISRFSLFMFDVRSAEINPANRPIVDLIRRQIQPESIVRIYGFADRSGDEHTNQQLALERAQSIARALGDAAAGAEVRGQLDLSSYDQNLPEGRLYARNVEVVVESPIR